MVMVSDNVNDWKGDGDDDDDDDDDDDPSCFGTIKIIGTIRTVSHLDCLKIISKTSWVCQNRYCIPR